MLYADFQSLVTRRLQDTTNDQFSSAIVNSLIDVGIATLQAAIDDVNPTAFVDRNTFVTVANTDLYAKQTSSARIFRVEVLNPTTNKYVKVEPANLEDVVDAQLEESVSEFRYVDLGLKLLIAPTPTAVYTFRVWYVPIYNGQVSWDAIATSISPALHPIVVDTAVIQALAETSEEGRAVRQRIVDAVALIPTLFGRAPNQVSQLSVSPFNSTS